MEVAKGVLEVGKGLVEVGKGGVVGVGTSSLVTSSSSLLCVLDRGSLTSLHSTASWDLVQRWVNRLHWLYIVREIAGNTLTLLGEIVGNAQCYADWYKGPFTIHILRNHFLFVFRPPLSFRNQIRHWIEQKLH